VELFNCPGATKLVLLPALLSIFRRENCLEGALEERIMNMKNNGEIVKLEQLVESLISRCKEQKEKLHSLEKKLRDRDEECELLKLERAELQKQQGDVASRVAGLLGRIEEWETSELPPQKKGEKTTA
jgi:FtsZ-binding cell division protein ZapB